MIIIYSKIYSLNMHDYPLNNKFLYYKFKLHRMIDMHSKYDTMHKNEMFYVLIFINNHIICVINFILWDTKYILWMDDRVLNMTYESLATRSLKFHILDMTWSPWCWLSSEDGIICPQSRSTQGMKCA